jgi:CBS domain-containing protein
MARIGNQAPPIVTLITARPSVPAVPSCWEWMLAMNIREVMTRDPCCCLPSDSAHRAGTLMRRFDVGVLPVVDDEYHRRLLGVVTDRDLCLFVVAANRVPAEVTVEECMMRNPVCCAPDDDAHHALELMRTHHVHRLPAVNAHGFLVGMVSLTDLVRHRAISEADLELAMEFLAQPAPVVTPGS